MAVHAVAQKTAKKGVTETPPTPAEVLQQALADKRGVRDALTAYLTALNPTQRPTQRLTSDVHFMITSGETSVFDALCTVAQLAARSNQRHLAAEAICFARPKCTLPTAMKIVAHVRDNSSSAFADALNKFVR
jgi:hypothetical protein